MIEVTGFKCEYCGQVWKTAEKAMKCESGHVAFNQIEITECYHAENSYEQIESSAGIFPQYIIVEKKGHSGTAAKYELIKAGSVEGIYTDE